MINIIIQKELKEQLQTPKFLLLSAITLILCLTSVYIGVNEYHKSVERKASFDTLISGRLSNTTNWARVPYAVHREIKPLQIFASGLHYDMGRLTAMRENQDVQLRTSPNSEESIFALFRQFDFVFVCANILSLFMLLLSFDSINGEKEQGTLKLALSNTLSRKTFYIAKYIGTLIGALVPILFAILGSLLFIELSGINLSSEEMIKILLLFGLSILYLSLFIAIGMLASSYFNKSIQSLTVSLMFWILMILMVPKASSLMASVIQPIPARAETEAIQRQFVQERWSAFEKENIEKYQDLNTQLTTLSPEEQQELIQSFQAEASLKVADIRAEILENERSIKESAQNQELLQTTLAKKLARFSPAGAFQLTAMRIAGNGLEWKNRLTTDLRKFHGQYASFIKERQEESGDSSTIRLGSTPSQEKPKPIDKTLIPLFEESEVQYASIIQQSFADISVLLLLLMSCIGFGYFQFARFDLR